MDVMSTQVGISSWATAFRQRVCVPARARRACMGCEPSPTWWHSAMEQGELSRFLVMKLRPCRYSNNVCVLWYMYRMPMSTFTYHAYLFPTSIRNVSPTSLVRKRREKDATGRGCRDRNHSSNASRNRSGLPRSQPFIKRLAKPLAKVDSSQKECTKRLIQFYISCRSITQPSPSN